jgi:hypothetical protein
LHGTAPNLGHFWAWLCLYRQRLFQLGSEPSIWIGGCSFIHRRAFFIGASLWVSGIYATPKPEAKSTDNTAIQRLIEDTNAKAVAAFKESNKQLADQLNAQQQQFATEMRDSENRMLSDLQSHILAIRTALTERPAPPPRSVNDGFNEKPKPQGRKNR